MGTTSSPSTTTTQQSNPLGQMQANYLQPGWDVAGRLAGGPGYDPSTTAGQQYLDYIRGLTTQNYNAAGGLSTGTVPAALNFTNQALAGSLPQSQLPGGPQIGGLNNVASGAMGTGLQYGGAIANAANQAPGTVSPYAGALSGIGGMALNNPAFSSGLTGLASGKYIDPSTNPAMAGMLSQGNQALTDAYQTATAPQTASSFESAGRYGSGALGNAQQQNQIGLSRGLANLDTGIIGNAYTQGLNATNQAAATEGGLYNTGISNAANAYNAGGGLSLSGLQQMMSGLGTAGQVANQGYGTAASAYGAGANAANSGVLNLGGLAQMAPSLANFPLSQASTAFNSMWAPLQNYSSIIGSPIGGNTMTTQTTPYYSNTGQQVLSGLTGAASLASSLAPLLAP
jgi:hypothetical protein